jgi:hypothetical protein
VPTFEGDEVEKPKPLEPGKVQIHEDHNLWDDLRREEDRRYDRLEARVRKLESRGRILESLNDEKLYIWLFGAYIFFGFVVPLIREVVSKKDSQGFPLPQ